MTYSTNLETPPNGTPPPKFKIGVKVLMYFKHPFMEHIERSSSGEIVNVYGWRKQDGWLYEVKRDNRLPAYVPEYQLIKKDHLA